MSYQRYVDARSDAHWLITAAGQPDSQPATDAIEAAITHAVHSGSLGDLAYALERVATSEGHSGGDNAYRCVVDLLADWLHATGTQGRAAA
ncbi:hypothetical protein LCL99_03045 [Halomonas denitrificans]|uniref:hypothetical protein n=1 Tax=Halomonas denitrificans TaxID=370769 RepID=UPI001CD27BA1|nr:hypothetical protein [Halomonas denitrificans]MCA0973441.1 hypothetical protein [Halomonas denitrificans]